jgi:hypothetical protein
MANWKIWDRNGGGEFQRIMSVVIGVNEENHKLSRRNGCFGSSQMDTAWSQFRHVQNKSVRL